MMDSHMEHTVYFADKSVFFSAGARPGAHVVTLAAGERIACSTVLRLLARHDCVRVAAPDPDAVFDAFAGEFVQVEAAGGAVRDDCGRMLMIYRNGRWDLPKGHLESGESIAECALREVAEETGVHASAGVEPLCTTIHCYDTYGRWEMKRTHWFSMRYLSGVPEPQRSEGIERAAWLGGVELEKAVASSYPTIRQVFCRLNSIG